MTRFRRLLAALTVLALAGCTPAALATPSPAPTPSPRIELFSVSPSRVRPGDPVRLTWRTTADTVWLREAKPMQRELGKFYEGPGSGSTTYTVDPAELNPFQIVLVAGQQTRSVSIDIICPNAWFVANPPPTCARPAVSGPGLVQRFEAGTMVWIGPVRWIVMLWAGDWPNYQFYTDGWEPGMPKSDPGLIPPAGLVQPVRRFGQVWRAEGGPARFGWALAAEYGMPVRFQCDATPPVANCLLTGPDGVLMLKGTGKFAPYGGP